MTRRHPARVEGDLTRTSIARRSTSTPCVTETQAMTTDSRLYANGWVVTMDDAGTEHAAGWVLVEDEAIVGVGGGQEPLAHERIDLRGAVVTPGLVNTHHHLYQTLTRARAQQADLFTWLRELYPVWAGIDAEAEYAAARTGLAELALSGCSTVFDHHYVFPRGRDGLIEAEVQAARELGVRIVASRGSMDLGVSDGGLPPDELVEDLDAVLAETERLAGALHEDGPGARVQIAVAPCSPFSVTGRLMEESADARAAARPAPAHAPRRDGRGGGVLPGALRLHARRVPRAARLARRRRLVRPLRPPVDAGRRALRGEPAPASPTARPRTSGSAPASRRCATSSTPACASASASTAPRRTSAATSSSRSSRRCSSRAGAAARRR